MFFGLFKQKDHRHYQALGAKYLAAERYADARVDFQEALKRCPAEATQDALEIRKGLDLTGDRLGELNLQEGEHSLAAGELAKAYDHFTLAGELAADDSIKAKAAAGLKRVQQPMPAQPTAASSGHKAHGGSSCGTCKDAGSHGLEEQQIPESNLSEEDRFSLMIQPLPGELAGRYATLGHEFAKAYLLIHEGNDADAFPILKEMLVSGENDIVFYEVALIMYRSGQVHESEKLLNRALLLNPGNSMCYLALVQLMAERGRYPEAIRTVERMMELGILADQAQFMLGELHEASGDEASAMEMWSKSLELPGVARSAAERLIPILNRQGRSDEVKYLSKRYLKGCC